MNPQAYISHFKELLDIERKEDLHQYREQVLKRSLQERQEKGLSWYPVHVKRVDVGLGEKLVLSLQRSPHPKPHAFQSGAAVVVFGMLSNQETGRTSGVVTKVHKDQMTVALGIEHLPDWLRESKLGIDLDFDDRTYKEMAAALDQLQEPKDHQRLGELRDTLLGQRTPEFHVWEGRYYHPYLNPSQQQAVQRCLEAKDVAIIHGPPGTGKTTTLVATIREILQREHQVLVCAPSNTAVDLLTDKCHQEGLSVLRIGNPARVDEDLHQLTLDGQIQAHPDYASLRQLRKDADKVRRQALKFKRKFDQAARQRRHQLLKEARETRDLAHKLEDYIIHQLLNQTQVICCTLAGSTNKILGRKRFHTVCIDEAAQALAPACWIPVLRSNRLILAGDHCQLPPTVKSMEAEKRGLGKTLFEHIVEAKPEVSVMLKEQYRMHEQIMGFSGRQFYRNELQASPSVKRWTLGSNFPPVEFVDTAGCGFEEHKHPETLSTFNPKEAQLLLRHLAMLLNQLHTEAPDAFEQDFSIGVIAPYKEQVRVLRNQLRASPMLAEFMPWISINTVDGFQGQERDVMYISLVRSNAKGEIGFLADIRRMNVAMTRARKKLVIVGDSATLGNHHFYQAFLDYVDEIGAYRSAWEYQEES